LQVTGFESLSSATENAELIKTALDIDNVWIFEEKQPTNAAGNTGCDCSAATEAPTASAGAMSSGLSQSQTAAATQAVPGPWVINLLSSTELVDVERLAATAAGFDLTTAVDTTEVNGTQTWRLQITGFDSYSSASEYAESAKQLLGLNEVWIFKKQ
jgi:hypothetical protein